MISFTSRLSSISFSLDSIIRPFSHMSDIVDHKRALISFNRLFERSAEQLRIGSDSRIVYSTRFIGGHATENVKWHQKRSTYRSIPAWCSASRSLSRSSPTSSGDILSSAVISYTVTVSVTSGCSKVELDHRDDDAELIMSVRSTSSQHCRKLIERNSFHLQLQSNPIRKCRKNKKCLQI